MSGIGQRAAKLRETMGLVLLARLRCPGSAMTVVIARSASDVQQWSDVSHAQRNANQSRQ
jgi:hypothetical protein